MAAMSFFPSPQGRRKKLVRIQYGKFLPLASIYGSAVTIFSADIITKEVSVSLVQWNENEVY